MTIAEYNGLSLEKRKMLFAAKLLPMDARKTYWEDCLASSANSSEVLGGDEFGKVGGLRFSGETLRAIVREADENCWWPTRDTLHKFLVKLRRSHDGSESPDVSEQELMMDLDSIALVRALILALPSSVDATLARPDRPMARVEKESVMSAVVVVQNAASDEPEWDKVACSEMGRQLLLTWLDYAFFNGEEVRIALDCLRRLLLDGLKLDDRSVNLYCALCTWRGWQEGLDVPALDGSLFAQGCRQVLAGDLADAYNVLVESSEREYETSFAEALLCHAVLMAVRPSIGRAVKIMQGCGCGYNAVYGSRSWQQLMRRIVAYGQRPWLRLKECYGHLHYNWEEDWGRNGAFRSLRGTPGWCDRLDYALRFAWAWWAYGEADRALKQMRDAVGKVLDYASRMVASGYVNVGGLFLSLVPELANGPAAKPILEAMNECGVWLLPLEKPEPTWVQFLATIRQVLEAKESEVKVPQRSKIESVNGRIVWVLTGLSSAEGHVSLHSVDPIFRERLVDGSERDIPLRLHSLSTEKYHTCVSAKDLEIAKQLREFKKYGHSGIGVSLAGPLEVMCEMEDLELVETEEGKSLVRTPVRIERRPCTMSSMVAEDGSLVLELSAWCGSYDYALLRTERKNVLAFVRVDEKARNLAKIFRAFGQGGKVVLPPNVLAEGGGVLEKLGEVIATEKTETKVKNELSEVKAKVACIIRLVFADGCLAVHVLTRPIEGNAELLLEPGFGPEKRLVKGANGDYLLVRDLDEERSCLSTIRQSLADYDNWFDGRCSWAINDAGAAIAAVERLQSMTPAQTIEWDKQKRLKVSCPKVKIVSSGERRGWFDVSGTFATDGGKVHDVLELLSALRSNGVGSTSEGAGYVQLESGDYIILTREIRKQLGALAVIGQAKDGCLSIPRGALPFLASAFGGEGVALPTAMKRATEKVRAALALVPEPPKTLAAQLRPYQVEGYRWLSRLAACGFGACLADDMGLGKTLQTIALLLERAKDGASLVIAPASVCGNWRDEIRRFAPTLEPIVALEEDEETVKSAGPRAVVIASYGYLLFHERLFRGKDWNGIVLDEAQAIKNADAKRTKLVKDFKAKFRVAATGTPVENRIEELWSLFDFLNPGLLGTRDSFAQRSLSSVKPFVKPLVLRRLKGEVLDDLPQKTEVTRFVELDVDERSAYEACRLQAAQDVAGATKKERMGKLLAGLTRLRRFCCNPSLVLGKNAVNSAKLAALAELMEELREGGHRALVFSQFTDYLAIVRKMVGEKGWSHQYLDGETPLKERGKRVEAFQNGEGDFFLISLKAGGTGLNLTAADYVIILDPWWNPAVENQAADRAHRIGQHRPVTIYRLIAKDTVEERVLELHHEKLQLSAELLEDTSSSGLTSEQLLKLLS